MEDIFEEYLDKFLNESVEKCINELMENFRSNLKRIFLETWNLEARSKGTWKNVSEKSSEVITAGVSRVFLNNFPKKSLKFF